MTTKTIFMGTPPFSLPSLKAIIETGHDLVAVYTQPDKQVGRGRKLAFSAVKEFALSRNLNILQPDSLKTEEAVQQMRSLKPDVAVVAAYGKIVPESVLGVPRLGFLNIHPSLLPKHRGATPIASAILQGDRVTGVSIILLDAGMDSGPLIRQKEIAIADDDTAGTLSLKLSQLGAELLTEVLPLWLEGKIEPHPQDDTKATYSTVLTKEDGRIDWQLDAVDIWRRVRALQPWPGSYSTWKGRNIKLLQVIPLTGDKHVETGKIISLSGHGETGVAVGCGNGILGLVRVQIEGKREMPIAEFIRGQRDFIGSILL
jgi:methionyl-tRNA formyltransferase